MMTPLEYLFFALFSSQNPDPSLAEGLNSIAPAAGDATANISQVIERNDHFEMRTILMEPRDSNAKTLEAPMRITAEWVPVFKIGTPISVQIDGSDKTYTGKIERIESVTDKSGQVIQAIAAIRTNTDLQPGMVGLATMKDLR